MALIDIKWKPSTRDLRVFAVLWMIFFGLLGSWLVSRNSAELWVGVVWSAALSGGVLGVLFPNLLRPIYILWMGLAFPIGWVISHVILGLVYFGILTPIGLLLRMAGHDPLRLKSNSEDASYWIERTAETDTSRYFRQF